MTEHEATESDMIPLTEKKTIDKSKLTIAQLKVICCWLESIVSELIY